MTLKAENIHPKNAKSYKRALAKVERTREALLAAKGDDEIVEATVAYEKARRSYGNAVSKLTTDAAN